MDPLPAQYQITHRHWRLIAAVWLLVVCACSGLLPAPTPTGAPRPKEITRVFATLDSAIKAGGNGNAATFNVPGFPYLRSDRTAAFLRDRLSDDPNARASAHTVLIDYMFALGRDARRKEILTLPAKAFTVIGTALPPPADRAALIAEAEVNAERLIRFDRSQPGFHDAVLSAVRAPDEYSWFLRFAGLYPLSGIPVAFLTQKVRRKFQTWFDTALDQLPQDGVLIHHIPAPAPLIPPVEVARLLRIHTHDPGLIRLPQAVKTQLARSLAPVIIQDVGADYDRPGRVHWQQDRIGIDTTRPTLYWYLTQALWHGKPALQLNYVLWYAARQGKRAPFIERGPLDGVTIRITLSPRGHPVMVDIMNNCGCYHLFVPSRQHVRGPKAVTGRLKPFIPQWLPVDIATKRLGVRINSGWHQIQRVMALDRPAGQTAGRVTGMASSPKIRQYRLLPYDRLEQLPRTGGGFESLFDSSGIAKGSHRLEPLLLFGMGIPKVGSMRQRGHHAVELVGRAHFDDPLLFGKKFIFR